MRITREKSRELLQTISAGQIPTDLSRETAQNALNIVIDAISSAVGGLIITDLKGYHEARWLLFPRFLF